MEPNLCFFLKSFLIKVYSFSLLVISIIDLGSWLEIQTSFFLCCGHQVFEKFWLLFGLVLAKNLFYQKIIHPLEISQSLFELFRERWPFDMFRAGPDSLAWGLMVSSNLICIKICKKEEFLSVLFLNLGKIVQNFHQNSRIQFLEKTNENF